MIILNLTPHPIHVVERVQDTDTVVRTYNPVFPPARLVAMEVADQPLPDGTPTTRTVFGRPVGLPDFSEGTMLIVSQLVKTACPDRTDLLVPSSVVRSSDGTIIGCRSLGR